MVSLEAILSIPVSPILNPGMMLIVAIRVLYASKLGFYLRAGGDEGR